MKKKILIVQPAIPHYNVNFFNSFSDEYSLTVAADTKSDKNLNNGLSLKCKFNIFNLKSKSLVFGFTWNKGLFKYLRRNKFDIIVLNSNPRDLSQLLLAIFNFRKIYSWGMFHRIGKNKLVSQLAFFIYSFCSKKVLVYSRTGALNLRSLFISTSKINIVGNGLSLKPKLSDLPETSSGIKLLQVVRLSNYKKPSFCIDAVDMLLKKNPNAQITFDIVGDGPEYQSLCHKIKKLKLCNYITMHGSIYEEADLERFFTNAHISIVPTCIGLSAHHSFSYGCPVITDNSLSNQASEFDILFNKYNSLIYDENSVESLCDCIETLMINEKLLADLRVGAFNTALQNNTYTKYTNFKKGLQLDA